MGYVHPLLEEIFAETYLPSSTLSSEQFFEIVPELKRAGFPNVEMGEVGVFSVNAMEQTIAQSSAPRVRCWSADRKRLIQLRPDMLVVNLVGEYPGWEPFLELFRIAHTSLRGALPTACPESLSLNTIDRFSAPRTGYRLGRYLNCAGPYLPPWYSDSEEAIDITLGRGVIQEAGRNRQIHVKVRVGDSAKGEMRVKLHDLVAPDESLPDVLERLHIESVAVFEALITDETRNVIMGGRENR